MTVSCPTWQAWSPFTMMGCWFVAGFITSPDTLLLIIKATASGKDHPHQPALLDRTFHYEKLQPTTSRAAWQVFFPSISAARIVVFIAMSFAPWRCPESIFCRRYHFRNFHYGPCFTCLAPCGLWWRYGWTIGPWCGNSASIFLLETWHPIFMELAVGYSL